MKKLISHRLSKQLFLLGLMFCMSIYLDSISNEFYNNYKTNEASQEETLIEDYNQCNNLNLQNFTFRINLGEINHRIAIISDETGYCLLDQRHEINCFKKKDE